MNFAQIIKSGRKKTGLTQQELARKLGKSKSTIQYYEAGKVIPAGDVLVKLAVELDLVPDLFPGYIKFVETGETTEQDALFEIRERLAQVEEDIHQLKTSSSPMSPLIHHKD